MNAVLFYHSLISDWNHGNAHFLRGIVWELRSRGHEVEVYEPRDGWSVRNLLEEQGDAPVRDFHRAYPGLSTNRYHRDSLDLDTVLESADLVMVHEWNEPELVAKIGTHRRGGGGYTLLFHDTHHRSVSDPAAMSRFELDDYDGVLAYGDAIREQYLKRGWSSRVWTWHEAADVRLFLPLESGGETCDVVWVGNWGDDERTRELRTFLFEPARDLRLATHLYGVRYPAEVLDELEREGVEYRGWLANFRVPEAFAHARVTVHVPRGPYTTLLPGIPTIRPFEAMACGIPLVSSPWIDSENLFVEGRDYLMARDGAEMKRLLRMLLEDDSAADELRRNGRDVILRRHTCRHRVDQLFEILERIEGRAVEETEGAA
jgi:CRISPR-associated Cas5-like protein